MRRNAGQPQLCNYLCASTCNLIQKWLGSTIAYRHTQCIQAGVCNGEYTSNSSCQLLYIGHAGSHCIHNCTYYNTSFIDKHYTSCACCYIPNIYNSSGSAVEDYKLVAESALLHLLSARVQVIVCVCVTKCTQDHSKITMWDGGCKWLASPYTGNMLCWWMRCLRYAFVGGWYCINTSQWQRSAVLCCSKWPIAWHGGPSVPQCIAFYKVQWLYGLTKRVHWRKQWDSDELVIVVWMTDRLHWSRCHLLLGDLLGGKTGSVYWNMLMVTVQILPITGPMKEMCVEGCTHR